MFAGFIHYVADDRSKATVWLALKFHKYTTAINPGLLSRQVNCVGFTCLACTLPLVFSTKKSGMRKEHAAQAI